MNKRKKHRYLYIVVLTAALLLALTSIAMAAVWTDKPDYTPGSVVTINGDNSDGAGYLAGEVVAVHVVGPNGYEAYCETTADDDGAWSCQVTLRGDESAVGEYSYTATGQTSGVSQQGTFTDAAAHNVNFITSGLPIGISISINYSGTNNGGNPQVGTASFTTPDSSADIGTKAGTTFTFGTTNNFPTTISTAGKTYNLTDISPASPFTTGAAGGRTTVTGTYELSIPTDETAPTANPAQDPEANEAGWNNTDVTIYWNWEDEEGGSGIDEENCDMTTTATEEGEYDVTGTCYDLAGNEGTASYSVKIDKTAPTANASASPDANAYGWNNSSVTVSFSGTDDRSGIASCDSDVVLDEEGAGQSASGYCYDKAGNKSDMAEVTYINIDLTDPTISAALDKSPAGTGWFNIATGAPTVSFTCGDELSGLDDDGCPGSHLFGEGAGQSWEGTVYDKAGNSASDGVSDIDVDTVAPSISAEVSPARPTSGWWNIASGAPTVTYTCDDGTSGVASCTAAHTFPEGENQSHTGTAVDNAGNSNTASVSDIDVDLTAPSLTWSSDYPADGGVYYYAFVPPAPECTAADDLSGPDGCTVTGYGTSVGSHTMTATAYDKAGNSYSEGRTYTVLAWTLNGFYQPVDMNGVYNRVKGGSTVPLKFEIFAGSTELTDVAYVDSLATSQVTCDVGVPVDDIETVATGGTSLRYSDGQFIFNWKTPIGAGKCYRVTMTTDDGSSLVAFFKMK